MLQLISYFEGHGGAVNALTVVNNKYSFFSAGSEGLIVSWNLNTPNEGEVIIKLSGLISSITYDPKTELIYATLNHKGLVIISTTLRKVIKSVDLPGVSFNKIELSDNDIITSTHFGELLVIDKESLKIKHRINTELTSFSSFTITGNSVCYSTNKGISQLNIDTLAEVKYPFGEEINSVCTYNDKLIISTETKLQALILSKNKIVFEYCYTKEELIKSMRVDYDLNRLVCFSETGNLSMYKIDKKSFKLLNATQIEHIGGINEILSIENHKFVITAGIDKKIGVWQFN